MTSKDEATTQRPAAGGRDLTPEEEESREAAKATGAVVGPLKEGGTVVDDTGRITYTHEGAISATPGGPVDPTILPEDQPSPTNRGETPGLHVLDREDAPGAATTGQQGAPSTGRGKGSGGSEPSRKG